MKWQAIGNIKGKDGANGKDAPAPEIEPIVAEVIKLLPVPRDGKDADPAVIRREVGLAIAEIPAPRDGRDGKDADQAIIEQLVAAAVAALPRAKDGADGKDGISIHPDTVKVIVAEEIAKAVAALPPAKNGTDGAAGRDALDLVPVIGIDETRRYQRGVWAAYQNGLVRAIRDTDPIAGKTLDEAGWAVMVGGVAALVIAQCEDQRKFVVSSVMTSGKSVVLDFVMPVPIYRGVYVDGTEYAVGDLVTCGGSMWHRDGLPDGSVGGRPGEPNSGWTLCVKKGRDFKAPVKI